MDFLKDRARSGRDFGKDVVWLLEGPKPASRKAQSLLINANGHTWCIGTREQISGAAQVDVEFSAQGTVKFGGARPLGRTNAGSARRGKAKARRRRT
jgi:hypothetical protein